MLGQLTLSVAWAVLPVPPLVELMVTLLSLLPELVPVTLTLSWQVALVLSVTPLKATLPVPAVAVAVPPQVFVKPLGEATCTPVGSVSVKLTPVSATVLAAGLARLKVSVEVPPIKMLVGLKALLIVGGAMTVSSALAVNPVPPSFEATVPVVLFFAPAVVPLTLTLRAQLPPAVAIVPPVKLMLVAAATGLYVPPQVLLVIGDASTSRPAGNVSLTATPVTPPGLLAGLVIVRVSVDVLLSTMLVGAKALVMVGGA